LKRAIATLGVIVGCATPFLALQIIENVGITGSPFRSTYRLYVDLYTPQMSFGFHEFDPAIRPKTSLPQRQDYYDEFTVPAAKAHRPERLVHTWLLERGPLIAKVTLPSRLLLVLLPLSVLALTRRERWVIGAALPMYVALYAMFAYLLEMYCVVIAPVVILWVLLGKEVAESLAGTGVRREATRAFLTTAIAGFCVAALPEVDHQILDDGYVTPTMYFSYVEAPKHVRTPAIILFRYRHGDNVNEEPVYNIDVAWPDDAPIIRAHDLGRDRDRALFAYYARKQPNRTVYLYDRASRALVPLGNVVELAKRFPATVPATASAPHIP
jgi:hypothetical protein